MSVIVLAFLHLLGGIWPGLSLKLRITTMGSLVFKTGLTSYFLVIFSGQDVDTILYPIVTTMDFAILSYFFSGFQYAIIRDRGGRRDLALNYDIPLIPHALPA
jgi:hypothetical protein